LKVLVIFLGFDEIQDGSPQDYVDLLQMFQNLNDCIKSNAFRVQRNLIYFWWGTLCNQFSALFNCSESKERKMSAEAFCPASITLLSAL